MLHLFLVLYRIVKEIPVFVLPQHISNVYVAVRYRAHKTRNAWQSLAYSSLGVVVLPPIEYL